MRDGVAEVTCGPDPEGYKVNRLPASETTLKVSRKLRRRLFQYIRP